MLGVAVGGIVMVPHFPGGVVGGLGKTMVAGGLYAGDRVARSVLRRRLAKLAHGQVELSRLKQERDGELVHVRGRVRARTDLPGLLDDCAHAVYRRVQIVLGQLRLVHEEAVDFTLMDDDGEVVIVEVSGARLVVPDPKMQRLRAVGPQAERLLALSLPKEAHDWLKKRAERQRRGKSMPRMAASEFLLQDGEEIDVVGYKNRVVDVSVEGRLERDTPLRATVRAGGELPVILSPALRRRS